MVELHTTDIKLKTSFDISKYYKKIMVGGNTEEDLRNCINMAVKLTEKQDDEDFGATVVGIPTYELMMLLPERSITYIKDGKGVSIFEWECDEDDSVECIVTITHKVQWTKGLGLENNHRLHFIILNSENELDIYVDCLCTNFYRGYLS